uniref:Zinc finger BED domain-containing protein 1-like n=1 Tax=Callorhinchus milii TaxID=7868 RepID=A0A4W3GMK7_CALMI
MKLFQDLQNKMADRLEPAPNLVSLGRAQSRYWTFFGFHGDSLGRILDKSKIICKLCGVRLSYSGNTTNLRQHLIYKHRAEYNQLVGGSAPSTQKGGERYLPRPTVASANARAPAPAPGPALAPPVGRTTKAIAQFIVRDLLPLSAIEGEGFVEMLSVLEPTYKVPAGKLRVTESLRGLQHCALSVDLWKHASGKSYVTLAAHHVDRAFDYRNQVLSSRPAGEGPTAETVRAVLVAIAEEWGVRERTSHAVVVSTADAELAAAQAGWRTLPCIGNVLQSCVDSALQQPSILKVLGRCKRLAERPFSPSSSSSSTSDEPTSSETLLRIHSKMSLGSGRPKWTCVYKVLQALLANRHLLEGLGRQESNLALVPEDWQVIEEIEELLKPLAIATSTFTREPFSGLSLVKPVITSLVYKHLAPNDKDSELAREVKRAICADLNLWYSSKEVNQTLNLACALDPRFRGLDFLSQAERVETLHLLKREAAELAKLQPAPEPDLPGSACPGPAKRPKQDSAIEYLLGDLCNVRNASANSVSQQAEQEISSFQTSEASALCQDPLLWWKSHRTQYPLLAHAARKLLAVPATAAPAAWVLTETGEQVYAKRSALDPEHVDMLVFLHGNGKGS